LSAAAGFPINWLDLPKSKKSIGRIQFLLDRNQQWSDIKPQARAMSRKPKDAPVT
jgi:hypothetical protein